MTEQFYLSQEESNLELARLLSGQIMLPNLLFDRHNPLGRRRGPTCVQGYTCGGTHREIKKCTQNSGENNPNLLHQSEV